jgi:RNA polymerase sigma-70 factor (ECF subfamily)
MTSDPREPPLDESAIRDFLARDYGRLVGAVTLVCGSRAAAEDAVQEALARAWERSDRGETIGSLAAWVTTVALNLTRSAFRRARAERRARERIRTEPGPAVPEELVDLERALASLPRRQREATVLRYYLDMDVTEVASALGMAEGTAKTTLFRARRALARALRVDSEEATGVADR